MCLGQIAPDHRDGDDPGASTDAIIGVNKVVHRHSSSALLMMMRMMCFIVEFIDSSVSVRGLVLCVLV